MSDLGIGQRAKERREQLGLSLQQVADRAGLTKSWLWDIEQGRNVNPTVNSTLCLARALGVPFGALVELSTTLPDLHPEALRIAIEVDAILRRQISPMEPNVGGSNE